MLRRTRWSPQIRERDTIGRVWRDQEVQETGDSAYCLKELVLALSGHLHPALASSQWMQETSVTLPQSATASATTETKQMY